MDTEKEAIKITELIANRSFRLFKSKKFRAFSNLNDLELVEQDRIFNEIIASGIVLAVLMFGSLADETNNRNKEQFYSELSLELINRYGNWLIELGGKQEHAEMFKKLIKLRADEYRKHRRRYKRELGQFKKEATVWLPIVSIGGFAHITRGNAKTYNNDTYFICFNKFISGLSVGIIDTVLR